MTFDMKKIIFALAAVALLFAGTACHPEDHPEDHHPDGQNTEEDAQDNQEEITVTGDVLDVTDHTATLTGYAFLPSESVDAKMGIMFDEQGFFENAKKLVATGVDADNMFTVTATGLSPSTTYYYMSFVQIGTDKRYGVVKSFITKELAIPKGAEDLGIVMTRKDGSTYKLYWAKSNLCETGLCAKPEDYGDYYAWGEIEPYYAEGHGRDNPCSSWRTGTGHQITGYNWDSYRWCNGYYRSLTKYCTSSLYGQYDGLTELQRGENSGETMDDAARAVLGGKWRMTTIAEYKALLEQCSWEWTKDYKGTGVRGRIVTSNVDGFKDKSIFFPAAGIRDEKVLANAGAYGYYWSSTLAEGGTQYGQSIFINDDSFYRDGRERNNGMSIRPVSE